MIRKVEQGQKIPGAALGAVLPQPVAVRSSQRGIFGEFRIGGIVTRHHGQLDAIVPAGRGNLFDAIRPIPHPAHETDDHQFRLRNRFFRIEVDRHVVIELHEVGETQA